MHGYVLGFDESDCGVGICCRRCSVLCPVFAVLASVNPSLIEFGLDDEDAIDGYYDMVYLCAVAVA